MIEDSLAKAQRHVREGNSRIARQAALIERVTITGRESLLREAQEVLVLFYAIQRQFEAHLEQELMRASRYPDPPSAPAAPSWSRVHSR